MAVDPDIVDPDLDLDQAFDLDAMVARIARAVRAPPIPRGSPRRSRRGRRARMNSYELDARAQAVRTALAAAGVAAGEDPPSPVFSPTVTLNIDTLLPTDLGAWATNTVSSVLGDLAGEEGAPVARVDVRVVPSESRYGDVLQISVCYGAAVAAF